MGDKKGVVSFDSIIQADRARKKNEQLAADIFGRNRNSNKNAAKNIDRSASNSPSLASRVGVGKRSSSTASNSSAKNPFRPTPSRTTSTQSQRDRANRLSHALSSSQPKSQADAPRPGGFSIKGKAGPWTVLASNFAPGTTAADIEATLAKSAVDDEGYNGLLSCRLTSTHPSVAAELVFSERTIAERIISIYNNQLADDRYLRLSLQKQQQQQKPPSAPAKAPAQPAPAAPSSGTDVLEQDTDMMAVDANTSSTQPTISGAEPARYEADREVTGVSRDQRDREPRRDDREPHRDNGRRDEGRERERDWDRGGDRRFEDRAGYDRYYDDRSQHDRRGAYPPRGGGRGYGGGVRGSYARAAGLNGGGGGGGGHGESGRGNHRGSYGNYR